MGPSGAIVADRYELKEIVGEGVFAKVYRAWDQNAGRDVVVKLLRPEIARDARGLDSLRQKIETLAQLTHPNLVRTHEFVEAGRGRLIVMEYIDGKTAAELLQDRKFDEGKVTRIAVEICDALAYLHSKGIEHLDLRPGNVMLTDSGDVKITDAGLADVLQDMHIRTDGGLSNGHILYMSPERLRGKPVDARSDIYSLGISMYELLAGAPPFKNGDVTYQHIHETPADIPGVSEKLRTIILKCLEKDPDDRFQSAEELSGALKSKQPVQLTKRSDKEQTQSATSSPSQLNVSEEKESEKSVPDARHEDEPVPGQSAYVPYSSGDEKPKSMSREKLNPLGLIALLGIIAALVVGLNLYLRYLGQELVPDSTEPTEQSAPVLVPGEALQEEATASKETSWASGRGSSGTVGEPGADSETQAAEASARVEAAERAEQAKQAAEEEARIKAEAARKAEEERKAIEEERARREEERQRLARKREELLAKSAADARTAMEAALAAAISVKAAEYAPDQFRQAESDRNRADGLSKAGNNEEARKSYNEAAAMYAAAEVVAREALAARESSDKARNATDVARIEASEANSSAHAIPLWKGAELRRERAEELYQKGDYVAAEELFIGARKAYERAEAQSVEKIEKAAAEREANERAEADRVRDGLLKARAVADNEHAAEFAEVTYEQARLNLTTGDEEYRAKDYASAARRYREATALFVQSTEQAKKSKALPEGLVRRDGKFISVKDGAVMVKLPSGEFMMGSPAGEGDADERPQHLVALDGFYMDAYEVTSTQFCSFLNDTKDQTEDVRSWIDIDNVACPIEMIDGQFLPRAGLANHPVTVVTWFGAAAYAKWAGKRLPTEAEWEYACRAGTSTPYNMGQMITHNDANFAGTGGRDIWESTAPVGSFPSNAWGLYDMHGNVWEWCTDKHSVHYYKVSPVRNPQGPSTGSQSVVRGGSWFRDPAYDIRSAYRNFQPPESAAFNLGFRCIKDLQ